MSPRRTAPEGDLAQAIGATFGDLAALKTAFVAEGAGHFGSGWVWVAAEGKALKVISTHDAEDLLIHQGLTPLLVCDLWEHAYYLDHKNDRKGFLEAWFDALPDWAFARSQYDAAQGAGEAWRHPGPIASVKGTVAESAR
jgi:Fe-Mn family superoxide dismutase